MSLPGVSEAQRKQILEFIHARLGKVRVRAFGSRMRGDHKTHSDLDLCLEGDAPLDLAKLAALREDLEKSRLPFPVDLVDWSRITEDFRQVIAEEAAEEWVAG